MKYILFAIALVFVLTLLTLAAASLPAGASPLLQDTATPTVTATPPYVIQNTVSVGEYGIAVLLSLLCLLILVMGLAASLWVFMQKRR